MIKNVSSKVEYEKLLVDVREHDRRYYQESKPVISDYEYDQLVKVIEKVEAEHPEWVNEASVTKTITSDAVGHFNTAEHKTPMLSLANTYSEEELEAFIGRMEKLTERTGISFNVELKMDGVALSVVYDGGKLVQAVTRGNGRVGDDVTKNALGITNLPHSIKEKGRLELRGEVFLPLKEFQRLNKERELEGLDVYANPRNAASGSLKLIDPEISKQRGLQIMLYDLANPTKEIKLQSEVAPSLRKLGLPVFSKEFTHRATSAREILEFAHGVEKLREDLPFEIDGIVVKIDNLDERSELGATNKSPRWAVAYKFAAEQAETIIESICVQVGRTGILTPVANLKPVFLSGSTISRATLHNSDEIERKDIREKDCVIIEKGGDVIPKVVSVVIKPGKKRSPKWKMPNACPHCGGETIHKEGEVAIRCKAGAKCSGQYLARIKHFVSKGAMNIENFGIKVVERFYELDLITSIPDIYKISSEDLEGLEGFKERSIGVLLDNIEKSKTPELYRFIFALGIPFVGVVAARTIADYCKDMDTFINVSKEELIELDGVGEKVAEAIISYLEEEVHLSEIHEFLDLGVSPLIPKETKSDHEFSGKIFVVTGTLEEYGRTEIKELIESLGGKVTTSVSKKTDFVLVGKNPGSKYDKALKLGITVLSEKDFKDLA